MLAPPQAASYLARPREQSRTPEPLGRQGRQKGTLSGLPDDSCLNSILLFRISELEVVSPSRYYANSSSVAYSPVGSCLSPHWAGSSPRPETCWNHCLLDFVTVYPPCKNALGAGERRPFIISFTVNLSFNSDTWPADQLLMYCRVPFHCGPPEACTVGSGFPQFNLHSTSQRHSSWVK